MPRQSKRPEHDTLTEVFALIGFLTVLIGGGIFAGWLLWNMLDSFNGPHWADCNAKWGNQWSK